MLYNEPNVRLPESRRDRFLPIFYVQSLTSIIKLQFFFLNDLIPDELTHHDDLHLHRDSLHPCHPRQ
jgi:hypothetical protein